MGIITAHSGCDGTEDNSLEFVTYALRSEAGCLEVDVRKGQDGDLILSHDDNGGEGVFLRNVFERMVICPLSSRQAKYLKLISKCIRHI